MMTTARAVFLVNLLQDVNILRPLAFLARDMGIASEFMVTQQFVTRDKSGQWMDELTEICAATNTSLIIFDNYAEAIQLLQGQGGILIAASESDLSAHAPTHDVMRLAPSSFLKVTLQHGFECVGFLQSRDHDLAHGREVTFAADVVCGWCEGERLSSMAPSQRSKLYVTGPTAPLQTPRRADKADRLQRGIVCENLHSVRLNVAGDFKTGFMNIFDDFCAALAEENRGVTLRPHPGGQYVLKNNVALQPNVTINNNPIYKVDLSRYAYGISAPSSVLIDMVLAGIPTGVWRDGTGIMDAGNYEGLTEISSLGDWLDFSREATDHPERFLERQEGFLDKQKMLVGTDEIRARFASLLEATRKMPLPQRECNKFPQKVLFISNAYIPTLQLSFVKPLKRLAEEGAISSNFINESTLSAALREYSETKLIRLKIESILRRQDPNLIVFCRYSGPYSNYFLDYVKKNDIPTVYHIDDDLLNIPREIGEKKYKAHNDECRLASVRTLLRSVDTVYCSTRNLKDRLLKIRPSSALVCGDIYCSGSVINRAAERPVRKIGYMGFDHAHDFQIALPTLTKILNRYPDVEFQLFGSIPKPTELDTFGNRVKLIPPIRTYAQFLEEFSRFDWDIGICPLARTEFNLMKANTKWVEYTSVGAAVVASGGTVYDDCCADGCGILASTTEEWFEAIERLINDPRERFRQVERAQEKLEREYSVERLRDQVLGVFEQALARREAAA